MSSNTTMTHALKAYCRLQRGEVTKVPRVSNITRFKHRLEADGLAESQDFIAVRRRDELVLTKLSDKNPIINPSA